jgi:hypothetical protein
MSFCAAAANLMTVIILCGEVSKLNGAGIASSPEHNWRRD